MIWIVLTFVFGILLVMSNWLWWVFFKSYRGVIENHAKKVSF